MNNITETWKKYRNRKAEEVIDNAADLGLDRIDTEPKIFQRIKNNPELYRRLQDQRTINKIRRGYAVRGEPVNFNTSVKGMQNIFKNADYVKSMHSFDKNADTRRAFGLSTSLHQKAMELPNLVKMGVVDANTPKPKNPQLGKKVLQRVQKISRILQRYPAKIENGDNGLQGN